VGMIRLTQSELDQLVDVATRVAKRTRRVVIVRWDRIELIGSCALTSNNRTGDSS